MLCASSGRSFVMLSCFIAVSGCGNPSGAPQPRAVQVAQAPNALANPREPDGPTAPAERKIIYNGEIEVIVDDLGAAQQRLQELIKPVQEAGGYLARQEIVGSSGLHRQGQWTIRVPISKFDGFAAEVEKLGELRRNSRLAQDVTEAYADLAARLRNKQASEVRLLGHLEKTSELKDTLECEREVSRVRGEIEQLQGQLDLLKNKTDLATVVITLHERENYTPPTAPAFTTQIQRTFDASWRGVVTTGQLLVLIAVALSPWLIAGAILLVPVWGLRRLRSSRG